MMTEIKTIFNQRDFNENHTSVFVIEPLELGQGITIANSLRRTLLSDLSGVAITGVQINNVKHEFDSIKGVKEDVLEILLNLKQITFKEYYSYKKHNQIQQEREKKKETNEAYLQPSCSQAFLKAKGPTIVSAGMFTCPQGMIRIINPKKYICTILDNSEVFIRLEIERGKGYRLVEQLDQFEPKEPVTKNTKNLSENESAPGKKREKELANTPSCINTILNQQIHTKISKEEIQAMFDPLHSETLRVDSLFMPVKKVNYKIKLIHDTKGNIKESLELEICTNGSITPKRALQESLKLLLTLLYPLLVNPHFLKISSLLAEQFLISSSSSRNIPKILERNENIQETEKISKEIKQLKGLIKEPKKSKKMKETKELKEHKKV